MPETISPKRMDEAVERAEAHTQAVIEHITRQKAQKAALDAARLTEEEQCRARIHLLASEIDANEEENRVMGVELAGLYKKIDKLKGRE